MRPDVFTLIFLGLAFLSSATFLWAYAWDNRWWASVVGRALVGLAGSLTLVLGWSVLRSTGLVPLIPWVRLVLYVVVFAGLTTVAISFLIQRRRIRHELRHPHSKDKP